MAGRKRVSPRATKVNKMLIDHLIARHLVPVKSSTIAAVGYHVGWQMLFIKFQGGEREGSVYLYLNVDGKVHRKMMEAESTGKFFHSEIKHKYVTAKIFEEKKDA